MDLTAERSVGINDPNQIHVLLQQMSIGVSTKAKLTIGCFNQLLVEIIETHTGIYD